MKKLYFLLVLMSLSAFASNGGQRQRAMYQKAKMRSDVQKVIDTIESSGLSAAIGMKVLDVKVTNIVSNDKGVYVECATSGSHIGETKACSTAIAKELCEMSADECRETRSGSEKTRPVNRKKEMSSWSSFQEIK